MVLKGLLQLAARQGRLLLVIGLMGGLTLPSLAQAMTPFLPSMVAFLIFVSALRIGAKAAVGNLADAQSVFKTALVLQLAVPLLAIAALALLGWHGTAMGTAAVLMLAAPSISGSSAFTVLLGHGPAPALRLLVLGTALLPLTILPIFFLSPAFGSVTEVLWATGTLTFVLIASVGLAFATRRQFFPAPTQETTQALDGLATLTLAVIVVGLMSAVGPALRSDPGGLLVWLALAIALNFGMQTLARLTGAGVATSIIAGNRNVALFLVALPEQALQPLLLFIGCYQVPMYLTPLVMRRFYA